MKTENEKLTARNIIIAAILLVLCVLSITTMCYTLGIYSYTGRTPERLTENGFGILDGKSELFDLLYDVYLGFQICSIVILALGVLSFAALGYYLYSLFSPNARLKLGFSVWAVSGLNLLCSGAYVVEGIILVVQGNGLFRSYGREGLRALSPWHMCR